jgi:hypothetical protein
MTRVFAYTLLTLLGFVAAHAPGRIDPTLHVGVSWKMLTGPTGMVGRTLSTFEWPT